MQENKFVIRHNFHDFDDFAQTARAWNLMIRQLERGSFEGDLIQFGTGNVMIAHAKFYPGTYPQGDPPKDFRTFGRMDIFAVTLQAIKNLRWFLHRISNSQNYSPKFDAS